MKKFVFALLLILMGSHNLFAIDVNENLGFALLSDPNSYQQYLNQRVKFYPKDLSGAFNTDGVNKLKVDYESTYVISKIYLAEDDFQENIHVECKKESGGGKVKFYLPFRKKSPSQTFNELYINIEDAPLYFVDEFEKLKPIVIGKKITYPHCKVSYTITDFEMDYGQALCTIKSSKDGSEQQVALNFNEKEFFEKNHIKGFYMGTLSKVEKPKDPSNRYGKTTEIKGDSASKFNYIDDKIDITISCGIQDVSFSITNISDTSIKLIWNEASYVNTKGSTSKIMHKGIKYSQREADQPATTIIKNAKLSDLAVPIDYVEYSDVLKDWITNPLFPLEPPMSSDMINLGEVRFMLPIQIKEVVNEYIFVFDVSYQFLHPEDVDY